MRAGGEREGRRGVGFLGPLGYGEGVGDDAAVWQDGGWDGVDLLVGGGEGWREEDISVMLDGRDQVVLNGPRASHDEIWKMQS